MGGTDIEKLRQGVRRKAARLLRKVAPERAGEKRDARIARAAAALGWPYGRTRKIWYEEATVIEAYEIEALAPYDRPQK